MAVEPLVSIICTVYNKAPWLQQTLDSFLRQETDFPIEIIVIDDASTDDSAQIIKQYEATYPELVRAFFNTENLGISRTWVKACQFARGHYIARCDGDDFWLDTRKLQKQVTLLQSTKDARWSNTDFDIYNEHGQLVSKAGFENGTIALADSFEKMLATRGFTMASTWLVERQLMLEVNAELDVTTSDDTFNLQMDLFQRTKLAYLPEATVAFVINQGSDSRPKSFQQLEKRFTKLLSVQQEYVDKYPKSNYREIIQLLLDRSNAFELELTKQSFVRPARGPEQVTIFFDNGQGFNEVDCLHLPLKEADKMTFTVPVGCRTIRIDLSENPSFYQFVRLIYPPAKTELLPFFTNAVVSGDSYFFPKPDPQLVYALSESHIGQELELSYQQFETADTAAINYAASAVSQLLLEKQEQIKELSKMGGVKQLQVRLEQKEAELKELEHRFAAIISSRRWVIPTKIINFLRRKK